MGGTAPSRPVLAEGATVAPQERRRGAGSVQKRGLREALKTAAVAHPGKRPQLWFEDEARVGNKGRVCHRWFLEGRRPTAICDRRYDWAYIFSAVRPATGEDFTLVPPEVSARAMDLFLGKFAQILPEDAHAVIVLDSITLVPLPPTAPNSTRSSASGSTCASATSPTACSTTTTPSSRPAVELGTTSQRLKP